MILATSDAAPIFNVLLESSPTPVRETVMHYLEDPREFALNQSNVRELGADRFVVPRIGKFRDDAEITLRKRIVEGSKVYCVHLDLISNLPRYTIQE